MPTRNAPAFLRLGGRTASDLTTRDWSASPLGAPEQWPLPLQQSLSIVLHAQVPMAFFWGEDPVLFFNDAFALSVAPGAVAGEPAGAGWPSGWYAIKGLWAHAFEGRVVSLPDYVPPSFPDLSLTLDFSPVIGTDGQPQGVLLLAGSRQYPSSAALHEELDQALEAGNLGTWDFHPPTNTFVCNNRTRELFGLPAGPVDLHQALQALIPADRDRAAQAIRQALSPESEGRYDIVYTVQNPVDGRERLLHAKGRAVFNDQGGAVRFSGILQDVTDENRHRRELEKLNQIIENSPDYMSMASLEGRMTYMNRAGRRLVGLAPEADLSGLGIRKFYGDEQFQIVQNTVVPALQQKGRWSGEISIRHLQTGEEIPCFAHYQLIPDPETGEWISRALTLRDLRPELQARREARESESRFQNLVQEAAVSTAIYVGREMRIQWANDAMLQLWGKDRSVVGKTLREALPELEGQPFHHQLDDVFTTGITYDGREDRADLVVEGRLQTFYFNFFYKALRDSNGEIYGILNMAMDVTEQVLSRRRLEESERNFRQLIEQAPVGIALLRAPDFVFELTNDNYCELVGKPRSAMEGKTLLDALPEIREQGFQELLVDVLRADKAYHGYETPVRLMRNGKEELIYCNFVYEPLKSEAGDRVLVVVIDITQQVEARQRVEVLEERLRMAVDSAHLGTFELIEGDAELYTSERFNEIFGVSERTGDPKVYIEAIHPDHRAVRLRAHERSGETGKLEYEVRVGRDEDPVKWIQVRGEFLQPQSDGRKRLVGVVLDITERKSLETELERRVQERTYELTRMNEELQQFAYVTSHDLKEPLRKLSIFSDLLTKQLSAQEGKAREYLRKITSSALRMDALVQSLLEYSRLSSIDDQFVPTDLNEVMRDVLVDFELTIEEKQAMLEIGSLPVITAIPLQVHQLFHNLVGNALKFAQAGRRPHLQVLWEEVPGTALESLPDPEPVYVHLMFADNGIGFDAQFSSKIFTIFQKLHTRDVYAGTGIGLAVCRKIVENHGGLIEAQSSPGAGSVFHVYLPKRGAVKPA